MSTIGGAVNEVMSVPGKLTNSFLAWLGTNANGGQLIQRFVSTELVISVSLLLCVIFISLAWGNVNIAINGHTESAKTSRLYIVLTFSFLLVIALASYSMAGL